MEKEETCGGPPQEEREKTMKVVAFNGSPRKGGNTHQCIELVLEELRREGIETENIQIGAHPVRGCVACYQCLSRGDNRCAQKDDAVNEWIGKMVEADGILLASPVYYGGIAGTMKCFLDRAFLSAGTQMRLKVGASLVTLRRSGALETYNQLNQYLNSMEMVIPTSNYWGAAHGLDIGEVMRDPEGIEIMQKLGRNMAWLLKVMEVGKDVAKPAGGPKTMTNFIR